jgi:3-methyl-2-oxobutanoate hydroxymethyltransferase
LARLTIKDLQQMKKDGRKIAAGVVYEAQMTRLFERAGVDLLSVGYSLSRAYLAYDDPSASYTGDEMLVFTGGVVRAATHAAVNADLPDSVTAAGADEVNRIAGRLKDLGVEMTKVDIRGKEEALVGLIQPVIDAGIAAYPQIGFEYVADGELHGTPEDLEKTLKWAHAVEDAGAAMIDLTMVTAEIYEAVTRAMSIPVIGGQSGPEADGKIYVGASITGYQSQLLDRADAPPNAATFMYSIVEKAVAETHSW